jgi:hypothetical protein
MRYILSAIGLNIVLCGLISPNFSAVAAPIASTASVGGGKVSMLEPTAARQKDRLPISDLTASQKSTQGTTIQGNGVEFTAPAGFKGGSPTSAQTQAIVGETARLFPSLASLVQGLQSNPNFFRAIAMNTDTSEATPSIVLITRLPVAGSISLKTLQETMSQSMPAILPPEFKLVDSRVVTIGDRQIVRLSIDGNIQGAKFKESIGLLKAGDEIYQITYVFSPDNAKQSRSIFEQMVRTFKTTPQTAELGDK